MGVVSDGEPVPAEAFEWTPTEIETSDSAAFGAADTEIAPVRPQMSRLSVMFTLPPKLKIDPSTMDDEMMPVEEEIDVLAMAQSLKDEVRTFLSQCSELVLTILLQSGQPNMVRLYEILGHDVPDFKSDFNVKIAIFLRPQDSKPFTEYRNRIHPSCLVQEIINTCLAYIKKKGWQPKEADILNSFGLFIPSDDTMREDEVMMNPKVVFWRFGFPRGSTVRLQLKPKRSRSESHTTLNLKVCVDGENAIYRNLNFYGVTPIAKVVQSLKTRYAKEMSDKADPYYGLYLYRGKKGAFLEDLSKSLSDMGILDGDAVQWKRRQNVELQLDRDATKKWMLPLDTPVGDVVARILSDLSIANPQQYAATRTHGKAGAARSDLFLIDSTPIKTYRLSPGDGLSTLAKPQHLPQFHSHLSFS